MAMAEDKLTHDERLRLECMAQAIMYSQGQHADLEQFNIHLDGVVNTALIIEEYVRGERKP